MTEPQEEQKRDLMAQLEQEYMIAQIISSFPSNIDGRPDIITPAPIRSKWAHRLYQQGIRVHTELATHTTVAHDSGIAGPHGPHEFQKIDNDRLLAIIQKANPALYKRIKAAEADHHGGPAAVSEMLKHIAASMPQEWVEKLQEAGTLSDDYAAANIPPEAPPP